jgi:hypothetical protein
MVPVLVSVACCVAVHVAWHVFTCRGHRGAHARADVMYSPYVLAERVRRERLGNLGRHHLDPGSATTGLLSGEVLLLSGHPPERPCRSRA